MVIPMKISALLLALVCFASTSFALTVEEAYQAIPHQRKQYDPSQSPRSGEERAYLAKLFALSDRALVERVETLRALGKGEVSRAGIYRERVGVILREISKLDEPASAKGLGAMLEAALRAQGQFFAEWEQALESSAKFSFPGGQGTGVHPQIRSASGALHGLYGALTQRYGNESEHNRSAFFQHLCALDFI